MHKKTVFVMPAENETGESLALNFIDNYNDEQMEV